jgi:hypothetical protein
MNNQGSSAFGIGSVRAASEVGDMSKELQTSRAALGAPEMPTMAMNSKSDPLVDPSVAPQAMPPIDDKEMHSLVDALRKVEEACTNALAAGHFDEVQVMLMKSALQGSLNAKSAFSLWVQTVKKDLQFLADWGDENAPDGHGNLELPIGKLE